MIKKSWKKTWVQPVMSAVMAATVALSPVAVFAAAAPDTENSMAIQDGLLYGDIVDQNRTGSLSIYKYDITAAEEAGDYTQGQYRANGEADSRVEEKLADYAVQGVTFTYLQAGYMEQYEKSSAAGSSEVCLVYEIPDELRQILGLGTAAAVDMAEEGVSSPCTKTGVYHYTGTQLSDALQEILETDRVTSKNALESYIDGCRQAEGGADSGSLYKAVDMPETNVQGRTSVSGLELGLYLVAETQVPEQVTDTVDPWFVSLPFTSLASDAENGEAGGERWMYDMVCYPKNQTGNPTLDKSVRKMPQSTQTEDNGDAETWTYGNTATASGGDILEYILVSKIPHITSGATYLGEYTFRDQLSPGLSYNGDVRIALYSAKENADRNRTDLAEDIWVLEEGQPGADFATVTVSGDAARDGERMDIQMTEAGLAQINNGGGAAGQSGYSDEYMVVYYTVTVRSDASVILGDEGNPNDASLLWSRTNTRYSNTLQDRNYVYSYSLDLTKTFSDDRGDASQVRFYLYNRTDGGYVVASKDADGLYYVTGKAEDKENATALIPSSADGGLEIRGLEADTYELSEAATDSGYMLLRTPVEISIQSTDREVVAAAAGTLGQTDMYVGDIHCASAAVDGVTAKMESSENVNADILSENALVVMRVVNHKGFLLPQTGGDGLYLITVLGIVMAGFGWYLMGGKRRKNNSRT